MNVRKILVAAAVGFAGLANTGCVYARIFYYNTPTLSAVDYFDRRAVHASPSAHPLPQGTSNGFALTDDERKKYRSFDEMLEANGTRAFVAMRDDRIVYERYFHGVTERTPLPDFSISKTFASTLVGCAIADHVLGPVEASIASYVPSLVSRAGYASITVDELLRMTSGIDFNEESVEGAVLYYSADLPSHVYAYDVKWEPGTH